MKVTFLSMARPVRYSAAYTEREIVSGSMLAVPTKPRTRPGLADAQLAADHCLVATVLAPSGTSSLSMTARHGTLNFALFVRMQAVIFGMLGISELQRRKASPVQAERASALKAKLDDEVAADAEITNAALRQILRIVGRI